MEVAWKPFQLRSNIPEEGFPKPGGPGPHQVNARLKEVGLRSGINFTGMCDRFPNTFKAHELMTWALQKEGPSVQNQLSEVLFRHYFTDGRYPDEGNLADAAAEVGLPKEEAQEVLATRQFQKKVAQEMEEASRSGITGVPFFYINGKSLGSGARESEVFLQALRSA